MRFLATMSIPCSVVCNFLEISYPFSEIITDCFNNFILILEASCCQPTLPSKLTPRSFCASTANSIGSSLNTSLQSRSQSCSRRPVSKARAGCSKNLVFANLRRRGLVLHPRGSIFHFNVWERVRPHLLPMSSESHCEKLRAFTALFRTLRGRDSCSGRGRRRCLSTQSCCECSCRCESSSCRCRLADSCSSRDGIKFADGIVAL